MTVRVLTHWVGPVLHQGDVAGCPRCHQEAPSLHRLEAELRADRFHTEDAADFVRPVNDPTPPPTRVEAARDEAYLAGDL